MVKGATTVARAFSERYDLREWPMKLDEVVAMTGLPAEAVLEAADRGKLQPVARGAPFEWMGEWQGLRFEAVNGTRIAKFQIMPRLVRPRLPVQGATWSALARAGGFVEINHAEAIDVHGDTTWIVTSGPKDARVEDRFRMMIWGPGAARGPIKLTRDDLLFLRHEVKRLSVETKPLPREIEDVILKRRKLQTQEQYRFVAEVALPLLETRPDMTREDVWEVVLAKAKASGLSGLPNVGQGKNFISELTKALAQKSC